ncbi:HEAT repeat domain-containing protein [Nostoc sp. 'Lobaria pulmonaria (5183) cyanobiont']|uniref:HEAT repeat domain-containing protein n=1 Tax=Nostoc sp. 'Lobaria pulmonaria (5183) cyanobiont' TaxID=1618022 RepID=UPI000CF312D0|nr:HEAT repeat domain-containing protein [Nostoc sp. 'Lobaria pulmonaria (5183) cyanobiont']AVH70690.1 PBS lyase HEAT-like repeat-containing protein [Nostoc sp. 'Lobaria pulmonaria (5183) cyanobiont']
MLTTPCHTNKLSLIFLFCFTLLLTFLLSLSWVSAKEKPKPKPQDWQINGISAALDDGYDKVKGYALNQLGEYNLKDLKSLGNKSEYFAQKADNLLKDEKVPAEVRSGAAEALGNLGSAAANYVPDIAKILKDEKVDATVRSGAAVALGNLGSAAANYVPDIAKILKDEKVDATVRSGAAVALGNLGSAAANYVPDILNFLKDEKVPAEVRSGAAVALGNLGSAAANYVPDIAKILKDEKVSAYVRSGAAVALGNLGSAAANYVPDILNFLKDEKVDATVRSGAAVALGNLGSAAANYVPDIAKILKDEKVDATVRSGAAVALGNLGSAAANYVPDIAKILKDEKVDANVRYRAAVALGNLGSAAANYVPDILNFLKDEKVDANVRYRAAEALGNLGSAAANYVPDIAKILKDEKVDANVRYRAAVALGNLGSAAANYVPDILNFLKDEKVDANVRYRAAVALGNLGSAAANYVPDIAKILKDEKVDANVRYGAAVALGKIRKLELKEVIVILNNFYEPGNSEYLNLRFLTYFLSGGTEQVKTLLKWLGLGSPQVVPDKLTQDQGVKTLNVFLQVWNSSQGLEALRSDLAKQISEVAANKNVPWQVQDIGLLQSHYSNLEQVHSTNANAVQSAIDKLKVWRWFVLARNTILIHAAFWLALIFAYPKFPQVQAIFFWNPWVRRILGVGYVGFLLAWVPFLRRKLFEPFQPSLLADAGLDNFNDQSYFPQSRVKIPVSGDIFPVTSALPSIKGQIVLEGDSGLGKSMFLRHLVKNSQRILVYLPAQKCNKGVIEAIQDKLHGQAKDAGFLKNLIYSGAIDICIDGLNEVTADTRAKICQFVESYFRGNIIMTTQPLEWTPPSTAKTYYLQPLEQQQIQEFLISRQPRLPKDAKVQGDDYAKACTNYLTEVLNNQQAKEELNAVQRTLSNPMDLTVVALMLSQGKYPNLFRLQEQQYNLMAAEYLKEWNQEFPLKKFSAAVYQMRLEDKQALPADEFYQVAMSLSDEKYKMVVSRQWEGEKGEAKKEWYFRHDKIMDFFLVQNFLGETDAAEGLLVDRMGDPRFRGVYFLLATLLPLDPAKQLREKLIQYAADTKDNTVSNTFVQLLRTR